MLRVSTNLFARRYDGANDYDRGEWVDNPAVNTPLTFFLKGAFDVRASYLFTTGVGPADRGGFYIGFSGAVGGFHTIDFYINQAGGSGLIKLIRFGAGLYATNSTITGIIQFVVPAPYNATTVDCYVNNVLQAKTTPFNNTITSIASTGKRFGIATVYTNAPGSYARMTMEELSIVNYAKTPAEMSADFTAGTQSVGTGAFLLKVTPTYNNVIGTLDPTTQYLSSDGLNYPVNQFGVPNPMTLANDFRRIVGNTLSEIPLHLTRVRRI